MIFKALNTLFKKTKKTASIDCKKEEFRKDMIAIRTEGLCLLSERIELFKIERPSKKTTFKIANF